MNEELLHKRLELFPISTQVIPGDGGSMLSIAGCRLAELAEEYGTPLYTYDQHTLDACAQEYQLALETSYPGSTRITYAAKAFLCIAIAQWTQLYNLWIDCSSASEIEIARTAGVPAERILLHGVNKSQHDLIIGMDNAGVVVVDNLTELERIMRFLDDRGTKSPQLWLRLRPGLSVSNHAYTQTANPTSKFGLDFTEAGQAIQECLRARLPLTGLHFHLGSHFRDPAPLAPALESILDVIAHCQDANGWVPETVCTGGGWGVAYHEDDLPQPSISAYIRFIASCLEAGCRRRGLSIPVLHVEPGRSLVARAGVAVYRVGAVKNASGRRWILLDGGLADNPRLPLYRARYTALPATAPDRPPAGTAWLGGKYCESGDVLIEDLLMPDVSPGELIAVPASGAYQLSMSSNYNGALKPAVLWLQNNHAHLIQQRQTVADLLQRDLPLPR